jgi:mRNA interferase HigB
MRLIGRHLLEAFKEAHASCRKAIDRVEAIIKAAQWNNRNDAKKTIGANIDFVKKQTVIDAGGNKVRIIAKVEYATKIVLVTHVLDHKEYDKGKWKE